MYYKKSFSKTAKREFAIKMAEIERFCNENGISYSNSSDSYYFTINDQEYRVSNHSVEASNRHGSQQWHPDGREKDVVYIHASKTRIIEIYNDLKEGRKLNGRGERV